MADLPHQTPFGERLRRLRQASGLSQEALAERAGLTANAVGQLERGERRRPYPHTVRALAAALGLSDDALADLSLSVPTRARPTKATPTTPDSRAALPPAPPTPPIGREADAAGVAALLATHRMVTLTGPGGVGKTTLAAIVARSLAETGTPTAFVALAPVADPDGFLPAVAAALGVRQAGIDGIAAGLAGGDWLLVLDNLEQVLAAAPDVAVLLDRLPRLRVLATSRAPLRLRQEREWPVAPLALPPLPRTPSAAQVLASPAVRLFAERAAGIDPAFVLSDANAGAVVAICRRLDGLPLAIELAAAWTRALSPAALLGRLDRALPLLTGGPRDAPERQRTMRDAVAWSHDLLLPDEKRLFRRLAAFAGGWTLDAAETVAAPLGERPVLLGLASLLEHNLVVRLAPAAPRAAEPPHPDPEPRFGMLETIREFALDKLAEAGEEDVVGERHADWVRGLMADLERSWFGPELETRLVRWDRERGNVRAALTWLLAHRGSEAALAVAVPAGPFWYYHDVAEGRRLLAMLLPTPAEPSPTRAMGLMWASVLAARQGDRDAALAYAEQAVAVARACGDRASLAEALCAVGAVLGEQGRWQAAGPLFAEAWDVFQALGQAAHGAQALLNLGLVAADAGDADRARALCRKAVDLRRGLGNPAGPAILRHALADLERRWSNAAEAERLYLENLDAYRDLDNPEGIADSLVGILLCRPGQLAPAAAAEVLAAAGALHRDAGTVVHGGLRAEHDALAADLRRHLAADPFAAVWDAVADLPPDAALAAALARLGLE